MADFISEQFSEVRQQIQVLVGLKLSLARNAAATKTLQFGEIRPHPKGRGTVGAFALHLECPWRLTRNGKILTGSGDRYVPAPGHDLTDEENWSNSNLQASILSDLFGGADHITKAHVNKSELFVVKAVNVDAYGGLAVDFLDGIKLEVFPDGSHEEYWRFFEPGNYSRHFEVVP